MWVMGAIGMVDVAIMSVVGRGMELAGGATKEPRSEIPGAIGGTAELDGIGAAGIAAELDEIGAAGAATELDE